MKSRTLRHARFLVGLVAVAVIVGIACFLSTPAQAGPFARGYVCGPSEVQCVNQLAPVQLPGGDGATQPAAGVPLRERAVFAWNRPDCPNGHCRPHDEVVVNVIPPKTETPCPPAYSAAEPTPPPRFPYGVLLAVLIPVVLVASVVAFIIRVATSRA